MSYLKEIIAKQKATEQEFKSNPSAFDGMFEFQKIELSGPEFLTQDALRNVPLRGVITNVGEIIAGSEVKKGEKVGNKALVRYITAGSVERTDGELLSPDFHWDREFSIVVQIQAGDGTPHRYANKEFKVGDKIDFTAKTVQKGFVKDPESGELIEKEIPKAIQPLFYNTKGNILYRIAGSYAEGAVLKEEITSLSLEEAMKRVAARKASQSPSQGINDKVADFDPEGWKMNLTMKQVSEMTLAEAKKREQAWAAKHGR